MSIYKTENSMGCGCSATVRTLAETHPLVDESRSTGNGFHLRALIFPTGDVELLAMGLNYEDSLRRGGGASRKVAAKSEMSESVLKKSQYRSKRIVYQKILTLQADTLLTLTYRDNQEDLDLAWAHFSAFSRLMKKRYKHWSYVCVPEKQERGAIHFHLAIKGYFHWNTVRRFWKEAIGGEGNVDFKKRTGSKVGYVTDPRKIARYLSKYLTKQDMVGFNKKRYSSTAITLPAPINGWLAFGVPVLQVLSQIKDSLTRRPTVSIYEADGYFPIFMLST